MIHSAKRTHSDPKISWSWAYACIPWDSCRNRTLRGPCCAWARIGLCGPYCRGRHCGCRSCSRTKRCCARSCSSWAWTWSLARLPITFSISEYAFFLLWCPVSPFPSAAKSSQCWIPWAGRLARGRSRWSSRGASGRFALISSKFWEFNWFWWCRSQSILLAFWSLRTAYGWCTGLWSGWRSSFIRQVQSQICLAGQS